MIRLLGFCLGSIVSISALVFLVGMPDFHLASDADDLARFDAAVDKLKAKRMSQAEADAPEPADDPDPVALKEAAVPAVETPTDTPEQVFPAAAPSGAGTDDDSEIDALPPPREDETEWHVLWTPFRSEIAARGFVSRLESVTGLDYRVVRLRNGVYEVAVPYRDASELSAKLSQISSATGLDLGGGLP